MTSIGGPCQREVCGDTHRMILRDQQVMCTHCPIPCRECADRNGGGAFCAVTPCECACHRKTGVAAIFGAMPDMEDPGAPAPVRRTSFTADMLARAEGAMLGYRMRALLAEAERDEAAGRHEALMERVRSVAPRIADELEGRMASLLEGPAEAERRAYTIGRRDGLACAAQRVELERDVIEAAKAMVTGPIALGTTDRLLHAARVLIEAERAKEGG